MMNKINYKIDAFTSFSNLTINSQKLQFSQSIFNP